MMNLYSRNGLFFFKFSQFADIPWICHGIFTRMGGESSGFYSSFNFGREDNGKTEMRDKNRAILSTFLGKGEVLFLRQVHGDDVISLSRESGHLFGLEPEADAVVTDRPGVWLSIAVADCQSVMLLDESKKVIGNIHSGWRGSTKNIIARTVKIMIDRFHCSPKDIHAAIGPSLGPCCSEFLNYRSEIPECYWSYRVSEFHFNFWKISRNQLIEAGIPDDKIYESRICTKCNPHLFFSYRYRKETGRFVSVIGIKQSEQGDE